MLHAVNNGLVKLLLFLVVGNLILLAGSSAAADLRGMLRARPISAGLAVLGLFAITGSPPFGPFLSEFAIVSGAFREHHPVVAAAVLVLLAVIFVGIGRMILEMVLGDPVIPRQDRPGEARWMILGPIVLAVLAVQLCLGVSIVWLGVPLPIAVLHNGVAALLLLAVINANQRIRQR